MAMLIQYVLNQFYCKDEFPLNLQCKSKCVVQQIPLFIVNSAITKPEATA